MTRRILPALFAALVVGVAVSAAQQLPAPQTPNPPLFKGEKPKKEDGSRSVSGAVRDAGDALAADIIVKIKDTKTLAIRSFITKDDGAYSFQGLSSGVDYEIKAESRDGAASPTKILSVYDNRKMAVINLKLEPKKN